MKVFAAGALAFSLCSAAFAQGGDTPGGYTPGQGLNPGGAAHPNDGNLPLRFDAAGPFKIATRGDRWCGKTVAEVPDPPQLLKTNLQPTVDALPDIVHNAMLIAVLQVDESGAVGDAEVKGGWPKSDQFAREFRLSVKTWRFAPGHPGLFCATMYIDVDGQVAALYSIPDTKAPQPSTMTEIPYPEYAYDNVVPGEVTLAIDLDSSGEVMDARVVKEVPNGYGFGRAAAETVKAEWKFDGAVAGRYRLKLKFAR